MHQGQLSKEPTAELSQERSRTRSYLARSNNRVALHRFYGKHQDEGSTAGVLRKRVLVILGQLTASPKPQVCSRTAGVFMRHWMPDVQLVWSEGVTHMLDESRRLGSILKPLCE